MDYILQDHQCKTDRNTVQHNTVKNNNEIAFHTLMISDFQLKQHTDQTSTDHKVTLITKQVLVSYLLQQALF